ncbi:MAG: ACT domain-containing protein [Candidatus Peribacteraceae bacterium]|nr:ACT domain-containing protein [Candidatus Peribacteraceae bacterium]
MEIVTQINFALPNHPGSLARMTDNLRAADVNIEAIFCEEGSERTMFHLIVDDPETAKIVLRTDHDISETPVLAITAKNKPGSIAHIARMCGGAGINIRHIYATSGGRESTVYLSVDDLEKAKVILGK